MLWQMHAIGTMKKMDTYASPSKTEVSNTHPSGVLYATHYK